MKYKFYSKNDKKKEAVGTVEADSYQKAVNYFAGLKRLSLEQFTNLYKVTNYVKRKLF